jgi:hypothetical protein
MKSRALLLVLIVLSIIAIAWATLGNRDDPEYPRRPAAQHEKSHQEILFEGCVASRDLEIHHKTFATIDNPDVQREVLAAQKEIAVRECRKKFPSGTVP